MSFSRRLYFSETGEMIHPICLRAHMKEKTAPKSGRSFNEIASYKWNFRPSSLMTMRRPKTNKPMIVANDKPAAPIDM